MRPIPRLEKTAGGSSKTSSVALGWIEVSCEGPNTAFANLLDVAPTMELIWQSRQLTVADPKTHMRAMRKAPTMGAAARRFGSRANADENQGKEPNPN